MQSTSRPSKVRPSTSDKENEAAIAAVNLDDLDLSDVETGDFGRSKELFRERSRKRQVEIEEAETKKRKVRVCSARPRMNPQLTTPS